MCGVLTVCVAVAGGGVHALNDLQLSQPVPLCITADSDTIWLGHADGAISTVEAPQPPATIERVAVWLCTSGVIDTAAPCDFGATFEVVAGGHLHCVRV